MENKKMVLGCIITLMAFGTVSCSDEGDPSPGSITGTPSSLSVVFNSNVDATLTFEKAASSQSLFNVRLTDQYGVETEFKDLGNSPVALTGFPKGEIYTVEIAGGSASGVGEYGGKSEALLASANTDKNNMVRVDMLNAINEARAETRMCGTEEMVVVPSLNWDDKLEEAAEVHTIDMHDNNFFAHVSATDNSDPGDRISKVGYDWGTYGENIAKGYSSAEDAVAGWLSSPGHCRNIMSPNFKEVGSSNVGGYWTQVFGRP